MYLSFFLILLAAATIGLTWLFLQGANIPVLNPKGWVGMQQRDLIYTSTLLMLIVVIPALVMTGLFAWKYRQSNKKAKYTPDWDNDIVSEVIWWGLPCVIIAVLSVIVWTSSHQLDPFKPLDSKVKPLRIQAVALQWKWFFIYPEQGIATVNYIQFPEQTPIDFEITADAPMNSFWIPQLGGQIYAMSGMKTQLHLIANEVGVFRGCSANLSGTGFSGMTFTAEASSEGAFQNWVERARRSPVQMNLDEYNRLVVPSKYNPVATYVLGTEDLFDQIVMKFEMPMEGMGAER
jgi:cytochrome o ubiquinol oxidase subunit 2